MAALPRRVAARPAASSTNAAGPPDSEAVEGESAMATAAEAITAAHLPSLTIATSAPVQAKRASRSAFTE
jgi:hypothetical protein